MYNSKLLKFIAEQNLADESEKNENKKDGKNSKHSKRRFHFPKNLILQFCTVKAENFMNFRT